MIHSDTLFFYFFNDHTMIRQRGFCPPCPALSTLPCPSFTGSTRVPLAVLLNLLARYGLWRRFLQSWRLSAWDNTASNCLGGVPSGVFQLWHQASNDWTCNHAGYAICWVQQLLLELRAHMRHDRTERASGPLVRV